MPEWSGALSSGETQTSYAGSKISATIKADGVGVLRGMTSVPEAVATGSHRLERNRLGSPSEYDASEEACAPVPVATAPGTDSITRRSHSVVSQQRDPVKLREWIFSITRCS